MQVNDLIAAKRISDRSAGALNVSNNQGWTKLLEEQQLTINSTLNLSRDFNSITFNNLDVGAAAAQIKANGSIASDTGIWCFTF